MDHVERTAEDAPPRTAMDRRAFFRRALLVAGGTVGVIGLAGCPNGGEDAENDSDNEQDDEQDNDGEDQDEG